MRSLFRLQSIDSKIDDLKKLRGELPEEVQDLEDEITGLNKRLDKIGADIKSKEDYIANNKNKIQEAEEMIARYTKQMDEVKNNREFDALTKEVDMQKLEIDLANKRIRDGQRELGDFEKYKEESDKKKAEREKELEVKREELGGILEETKKEEEALKKMAYEAGQEIEDRLKKAYIRIRRTYRNGLAVVTVSRSSCGGCYGKIPPQRQLELSQHKKVILCEHCGRILVGDEIAEQVLKTLE